jgi:hypothetical protein
MKVFLPQSCYECGAESLELNRDFEKNISRYLKKIFPDILQNFLAENNSSIFSGPNRCPLTQKLITTEKPGIVDVIYT